MTTKRMMTLAALWVATMVGLMVTPNPRPQRPPSTPLEVPVPLLESTPALTDGGIPLRLVLASIPPPGPNQLRAGQCDPDRAQKELNGGCWVKTETPPPCPRGKQWEHEGRCWLPVAPAKPVPTSGEARPLGVAGP
jgi:hypothetical protein